MARDGRIEHTKQKNERTQAVACLLAAGAPRKLEDNDGFDAAGRARIAGHRASRSLLKERAWAVLNAAAAGDVRELRRLLTRRSVKGYDGDVGWSQCNHSMRASLRSRGTTARRRARCRRGRAARRG